MLEIKFCIDDLLYILLISIEISLGSLQELSRIETIIS